MQSTTPVKGHTVNLKRTLAGCVAAATQTPVIAAGPASTSTTEGEVASFMVVSSGRTLATISWYRMPKDGTEATMIEGATDASYSLETTLAADGAQFYAAATNALLQGRDPTQQRANPALAGSRVEATSVATGTLGHVRYA